MDIWLAQGLSILKYKTFSPPETRIWGETLENIYPAWGAAIIYALIEKTFHPWGREAIGLFHKLVLLFVLAILYFKTLRPMNYVWTAKNILLICLSFFGLSYLFSDRPALLALVPFLLFYYELEDQKKWTFKRYCRLFIYTVLWINIHGSAILVLPMVFWHLIFRPSIEKKPYGILGFASLFVLMLNPFGGKIYFYTWQTAVISTERFMGEWRSPFYFDSPANDGAYFLWLVLLIILIIKNKRWNYFKNSAFPLTLLGLTAERQIVWAFLLIIPCWIVDREKAKEETKSFLNGFIVSILLLAIILLNPFKRFEFIENFLSTTFPRYSLTKQYPHESLQFLKRCLLNGPIFNSLEIGGWLELYSQNKVFFDARNIIFADEKFQDFRFIVSAREGWEKILQKYSINLMLLTKEDSKNLERNINNKSNWNILVNEPLYQLWGSDEIFKNCERK